MKKNYVALPRIERLTVEMSRTSRKFNIDMFTYLYRTIGNILPKLKDFVGVKYKRGALYKIPCKDCSGV